MSATRLLPVCHIEGLHQHTFNGPHWGDRAQVPDEAHRPHNEAGARTQVPDGNPSRESAGEQVSGGNRAPNADAIASAAQAYLDAEAEPAYSWIIESQASRNEGRPNREVERIHRIVAARRALIAALNR